ncbi:MAG: PKD domain-containing protein [Thermoplasmata archaeon]|jgi:plastocyanin|nr:PKD domain-containing protein [Thermoplasmata archaeon]
MVPNGDMDSELPPPPEDIAAHVNHYREIKTVRSGSFATVKRAFTIFEKDFKTMAKHGLVSSVILVVFLGLIFYIMSFAMNEAVQFQLFQEGEDNISYPGATESVPPVADAGSDRDIDAGDTITLDASGSTDNSALVYWMWTFWDGSVEVELYGDVVEYTFENVGEYEVTLVVVDSSWNMDEDQATVTVSSSTSDVEGPWTSMMSDVTITAGDTVTFDGSSASDNVAVVNWTWTFDDVYQRVLYGETVDYRFDNRVFKDYDSGGSCWVSLTVRDAAGNLGQGGMNVWIQPDGDDWNPPEVGSVEEIVVATVGQPVELTAVNVNDMNGSVAAQIWYIEHNDTRTVLTGQTVEFTPQEWGMYDVKFLARDDAGNARVIEAGIISFPLGVDTSGIAWSATPFDLDISFNLLSFAYGIALLASVIFVGGLFSKGFAHEIQKGTLKILFFGPISVTTMVFSKILYPIIVAPIFIFPLTLVALSPLHQDTSDILTITLVAYILSVITMVAAAYGSCLIYLGAKKMVLKPTVVSRIFLYLSLLGTMTVFEWMSFLFDNWFSTEMFGDIYGDYGALAAFLSPFHQGGIFLSNALTGTAQAPDWIVFAIPAALIVMGIAASHKLYPDLFSRE